jgi:AAA+ ATPase superfamily predicted ATPase
MSLKIDANESKAAIAAFLNNVEVTIPELKNIQNNIILTDNVTNIQYETTCIDVNISSTSNPVAYIDAYGYVDSTPYSNECSFAAKFENLIQKGNNFIMFWYTYRSISKAIPEIVSLLSALLYSTILLFCHSCLAL